MALSAIASCLRYSFLVLIIPSLSCRGAFSVGDEHQVEKVGSVVVGAGAVVGATEEDDAAAVVGSSCCDPWCSCCW